MKNILLLLLCQILAFSISAQVSYTANDKVTTYTGLFRPGINLGYYPPYSDTDLGNIAAGNPEVGISGIGARATRPGFSEWYTSYFGYDTHIPIFQHYENLGMKDLTCIIGFPSDEHRDTEIYCSDGVTRSEMFANLYTPIWDGGANGTPYNDANYLAAYMYKLVTNYKNNVKFWEIWNEPGFDHSNDQGWRPKGDPGNWFDNDPDPCANHLRAPVQHFIRTLRVCYDVIKTIDPDAYVALSGVGYESFLDAVLRNTDNPDNGNVTNEFPLKGGAYFDVMGFHTYPDIDGSVKKWNPSTSDWDYIRNSDAAAQGIVTRKRTYENRLAQYGYDGNIYPRKEWICTELNSPRVKFNEETMASDESQINYISKAVVASMKINLRQIHPYQLADNRKVANARDEFDLMGMYLNMEDTQPYGQLVKTNEGIAYKTVADFVFGTEYDPIKTTAMQLPNTMDGGAFYDIEAGHYKYIIWAKITQDLSEVAFASYTFPTSFGITNLKRSTWNFSEVNSIQDIGPTQINLSGRPIYLEEDQVSNVSEITLTCPSDIFIDLPVGSTQVAVEWANISAQTTCPNFLINFEQLQGPSTGSFFEEGTHTIEFKVSDSCENEETCSFTITVSNTNVGELTIDCPENISTTIPAGMTSVAVDWELPMATSTCNSGAIEISQIAGFASGTEFYEGEYTITYQISDDCNQETCSFILIVSNPLIGELSSECPEDITLEIAKSETTILVDWDLPTASTTCLNSNIIVKQIAGPQKGSELEIGIYHIIYEFSDDCDQTTCSFTIEITEATTKSCDDIDGFTKMGDFGKNGYYLSDNVMSWDKAQGFAESNNGNLVIIQTQEENDFIQSKLQNQLAYIGLSDAEHEGTITWVDGTAVSLDLSFGNTTNGDYAVINYWSGTWDMGYAKNVEKKFILESTCKETDSGILTFSCPDNIVLETTGDYKIVMWDHPIATTTCMDIETTVTQTDGQESGFAFGIGTHTISYEAIDNCGNISYCIFTITINQESKENCKDLIGFTKIGVLNNHAYYLSNNRQSWIQANINTHSFNGHLVAINTQEENDFIQSKIGGQLVFIGLNDLPQEGRPMWSNGDPLTLDLSYSNSWNGDFAVMNYWAGSWDMGYGEKVEKKFIMEVDCNQSGNGFLMTDTNNNVSSQNIILFPNPAESTITVQFSAKITEVLHFSIINAQGQVISSKSTGLDQLNRTDFEIDHLGKGIYFLKVIGEGFGQMLRFVKI